MINKVDKFRVGDDSIKGTLKKAYFDLKKLGFKKIEIYPISSYAAYLAKMLMYDEPLTEDEIDEIKRMAGAGNAGGMLGYAKEPYSLFGSGTDHLLHGVVGVTAHDRMGMKI